MLTTVVFLFTDGFRGGPLLIDVGVFIDLLSSSNLNLIIVESG